VRFSVVFVPERLEFFLSAQVPEIQASSADIYSADVATNCGGYFVGIHHLVVLAEFRFNLLQIGGFARVVQAKDKQEVFIFLCDVFVETGEESVHVGKVQSECGEINK